MRDLPESGRDPTALPQEYLVPRAVVDHVATARPEEFGQRPVLIQGGGGGGRMGKYTSSELKKWGIRKIEKQG